MTADTSKCSLMEAARPITPNDSVSLKGSWGDGFTANKSQMQLWFVVGDMEKSMDVGVLLYFDEFYCR